MIEEGFVQLYARDFVALASRAEQGAEVSIGLTRRIGEARSHAQLMDARKGPGHLEAVAERMRQEADSRSIRQFREGSSPDEALARRSAFLHEVIEKISIQDNERDGGLTIEPIRKRERR
ncbi:hypothetical protein BH11PSE2_BH11PSE2_10220 [soil metagenome]